MTTDQAAAEALVPSLAEACRRWAGRPAITFGGQTLTYEEVGRRLAALALSYRRLEIRPGDRVLCQLPNRPEHVIAMSAAWANGAVHVGVDNDLTGRELSWLTGWTGAAALLFQPRADARDPMAPVRVVRQDHPGTRILLADSLPEEDLALQNEALSLREWAVPALGPEDTALLLLTSGTTGKPKGVPETLPHCWAKMQFFADAFHPGPDDVHLVYLPMAHVFGLRLALIPLMTGGRLVLMERFSPELALRLVAEERVTVLPGMPAHFKMLLDKLEPGRTGLESLRWAISAATSFPGSLAQQVYDRLGVDLLYVYGCSEGFTTLTTDRDEIMRGSVGRTVFRGPPGTPPDGRVAILDPESPTPLSNGSVGEIAFGAARPVRYWRDPEVATDGWYRSGDLGRIEDDGCLFVMGRLKELVNRAGLKVSPTEVETYLARHPAVADAAVIATPDPVLSEATCACVVPVEGRAPTLSEVRSFLEPFLARHKLPDELCLVDHIPRTRIGKVDRASLAAVVLGGDVRRERLRPPPPAPAAHEGG